MLKSVGPLLTSLVEDVWKPHRQFNPLDASAEQEKLFVEIMAQITEAEMEEFKDTFDTFDEDGNGEISSEELQNVLIRMGHDACDGAVQNIMAAADRDGNGSIDFDEFCAAMTLQRDTDPEEHMQAVFKLMDEDNSGTIDAAELKRALAILGESATDDEIATIITDIDLNADSQIDFEEFCQFMKKSGLLK